MIIVTASDFTFEEGETRFVQVGDASYDVEIMIIEDTSPATATFKINNQITSQLTEGTTYTLSDGVILHIIDIRLNEAGEAGLGDIVTFSFSSYCGDAICDAATETCSSCVVDCGCSSTQYCKAGQTCEEIVCGDLVCSRDETCEDDNCCDGTTMNIDSNRANCGSCGNVCKKGEHCLKGVCKNLAEEKAQELKEKEPVCGDGACQEKENNCCVDCGCEEGYTCELNFCVQEDTCSIDQDCVDENPCTIDVCVGTPKECSNERQQGCILEDNCISQEEIITIDGVASFCTKENEWEAQKEESVICSAHYECLSGACKEDVCYVERTLFQRIFKWLGLTL